MPGTWTITSYGSWKDWHDGDDLFSTNLIDLGVTDFKIKFCNRAADEASIQFERKAPIFDPHDIWTRFVLGYTYRLSYDGTPVFSGRLEEVNPVGSGQSFQTEFVLKGGWRFLELAMYKYPIFAQSDWSTHRSIGNRSARDEIVDAVRCASGYRGAGIHVPAVVGRNDLYLNFVSGGSNIKVPYTTFTDCTCAEVLNKILAYLPTAFVWSSYIDGNQNVPGLKMDLTNSHTVVFPDEDASSVSFLDFPNLESFSISLPNHSRIPGVGVCLDLSDEHGFSGSYASISNYGDVGSFLTTISDKSLRGNLSDYAQYLFASNEHGYPEGSLVFVGKEPPWLLNLRPCGFLSLGLSTNFNQVNATPIQSVEFDIGHGRTTISFGPPSYIGTQDLVSLALANPSRSS